MVSKDMEESETPKGGTSGKNPQLIDERENIGTLILREGGEGGGDGYRSSKGKKLSDVKKGWCGGRCKCMSERRLRVKRRSVGGQWSIEGDK